MYKVLCDGALMCDSRIEELALINPKVTLEENKAGSFSFMIPPEHPRYDLIEQRKSVIQVYQNEELRFSGTCIEVETDFYKQKSIYCEGELTYFNDTIQRPARYQGITVRGLLEALIANHNAQVEERKQFQVGIVTVTDPNNSLYCYTNMETTMQCLKEDLVDDLGGFFRIRHENGVKYIDYLADSQNTNTQTIKFGKNLMDFTTNIDSSDIATAIIPLGANLETSPVEGLEVKLTIESVNSGADYVYSPEAVDTYGWIFKTIEYNDVTTAEALKSKGEKYLQDIQFENMVIEAKAIDLHLTDKEIETFKLSDQIRVVSTPHGLNKYFRLTKQTFELNNPEKDTITLGKNEFISLSAQAGQVQEQIKFETSDAMQQAVANATTLIANAMGGYVVKKNDELLIMDTDNTETATRVWRWNINGLGYSSTGYAGPYGLAMTMDGAIVADFIKAGNLSADIINGGAIRTSLFESTGTVTKYASDYTEADAERTRQIILGGIEATTDDYERYDIDGDALITINDWTALNRLIKGYAAEISYDVAVRISPATANNIIQTQDVVIGRSGVAAKVLNAKNVFAKEYSTIAEEQEGITVVGQSGSFATADGKSVTVTNGIITNIS